jgi:glycosyltransferase involved in cell wall biosynthesis
MPRVISASMFFPRGGSAHVLRSLARRLPDEGWDVTVLSGSRRDAGGHGDARRFYRDLDVHEVDFSDALAAADPLDPPGSAAPMHPSFEDRRDAPDRVFASLDDRAFRRQVDAWARALDAADAAQADVLHLHHLTPINEAARRVAPGVPVVGHLHGTELLMLERIADGAPWEHADAWAARMSDWAQACTRLVLLSETQIERARALLGIDPDCCTIVGNGYDPELFHAEERVADRAEVWRRTLVDAPRGWRPGEDEGSVAYSAQDVAALSREPVLLYVGRFTEVKRVGLLIEAHANANLRAPLVLVGGHPGEWEGEHPLEVIERTGARNVFLAGWHDHEELPELLHAADALVLPSVREQFGQVLVEAMACGLPCVAVDRYGPAHIVRDGETGWLVEPDDEAALAAALNEVVADEDERARRGDAALHDARERFSWPALTEELAAVLDAACNTPETQPLQTAK